MVNEKICARVDTERKTRDDRLIVRVGKAVYYGLLDYPDSGAPLIRYRSNGAFWIGSGFLTA